MVLHREGCTTFPLCFTLRGIVGIANLEEQGSADAETEFFARLQSTNNTA